MKTMQIIECTKEIYDAHCIKIKVQCKQGTIRSDYIEYGNFKQVRLYKWRDDEPSQTGMLMAMAVYNFHKPGHSQFFIYDEAEMGVTTKEVGL